MANLNVNGTLKAKNGGGALLDTELIAASGSNYIRYNSGIQICWGQTSIKKNSTTTINFEAFTNTSYSIVVLMGQNGANDAYLNGFRLNGSKGTSSCQVLVNGGPNTFEWIAIGKWK